MSAIPASLARVPNLLASQASLSAINRTSLGLLRAGEQISSGLAINRPSDDAVRASVALVLEERLEIASQRLRNMDHARSLLDTADQALADARDLAIDAQSIASSQIGAGTDATTRANQSIVVNSILQELVSVANRSFTDLHLFGGTRTGSPPIVPFLGGYRYVGGGDGLSTDLGEGLDVPVTVPGEEAFGALSARVEGDVDLNPLLTRSTRIADIRGTTTLGVNLGQINVTIDDGVTPVTITVDLSAAENTGDVLDLIESAVRAADPSAFTAGFPTGTVTGERLTFNGIDPAYTLTIADIGSGTTASDLGIAFAFDLGNPTNINAGQDLDPRLSDFTLLGDLAPGTPLQYGDIRFRNGSLIGVVTTNAGMSIGEFKAAVDALGIGARVSIGADQRTLDVVNEVSGMHLSIEEVAGGLAATTLGIRSFTDTTSLADFNFGRGVQISDGNIDPITGLPDASRDLDFRVNLRNGGSFTVDLTPADIGDVGALLARINQQAALGGFAVPLEFEAVLAPDGNGIVFNDATAPATGQTSVTNLHGHAAEDLGLLGGTFTAGATATLAGADRAKVRVDSVFSTLIELRDALGANDRTGITIAGESLAVDVDRLLQSRALVGARASRLEAGVTREEDSKLLNEKLLSNLRDLDYTEAATRFSMLQLAQEAGLSVAARSLSLTLLDFLR